MIEERQPDTELSFDQLRIVNSPISSKLLIEAGPGTGKTFTLINRCSNLIKTYNLSPYTDILVLSFSRAAISEIRTRLSDLVKSGETDDLRFLNIRTFDSFATRLLLAADEEVDLSGLVYDTRIKLAVKRLADPESNASYLLQTIKHLMIDEVQDLVGERAQLVQAILQKISGGFTLFGDPAQGIFDYLVKKSRVGPTSEDFMKWIRSTYKGGIEEIDLHHNYRTLSSSAEVAARARSLVMDTSSGDSAAYKTLREIIDSLESVGTIQSPDRIATGLDYKRIAILCRSNAEVLFTSNYLIQKGVKCIVPPKIEDKGIPAWVAKIFSTYDLKRITYSAYQDRWNSLIKKQLKPGFASGWGLLKSTEGRDYEDLDLDLLKTRLRKGIDWTFDSESYDNPEQILVSTIHQSKGREYDQVIILPPESNKYNKGTDALEEARVLYVAATRARKKVSKIEREGLPVIYDVHQPSGRERQLGQNYQLKHFFEVIPSDTQEESYADSSLFPEVKLVSKVQELIWNQLVPGTRLVLTRQKKGTSIIFVVAWINPKSGKPVPICMMDNDFKVDLESYIQSISPYGEPHYLKMMEGLVVYERRTIVLPPYLLNVHEPYRSSRFLVGLGIKGLIAVD